MINKLNRPTADILVAEHLKKWIIESNLKPGMRLPSEQFLCTEFGVGRHTLREGIKRLAQLGILESRTGSGTYVADNSFEQLQIYLSSLKEMGNITSSEIYDVRSALESYAAATAASRATKEDIAELKDAVSCMKKALDEENYHDFIQYNLRFHIGISNASKNNFLVGIIDSVKSLIVSSMESTEYFNQFGVTSYEGHSKILSAIIDRDPDLARSEMLSHLKSVTK